MLAIAAGCTPEHEPGPETEFAPRVHEGDYTIAGQPDVARIADVGRITGKLTIKRSELAELALPRLTEVGGRLAIQKNKRLRTIVFSGLEKVGAARGDDLLIEHNPQLGEVRLGALVQSHGVKIRSNDTLARVDLGRLEQDSGNGLDIESNHALTALELGALRATQRLAVGSCTKLQRLDVSSLAEVSAITIVANPVLSELSVIGELVEGEAAPSGRVVGARQIRFSHNAALRTCDAQRLIDRLRARGWRGESSICGSTADTCGNIACR